MNRLLPGFLRALAPAVVLCCLVVALLPIQGGAAVTGERSAAAAPAFDWIRQFGSAGPDYVHDLAADGGSVYLTAGIYAPARDQYLTSRYDADGNEVWTRDNYTCVAAGPGGTYVGIDCSLRRLDGDGHQVWARGLVDERFTYPVARISVSSSGVYISGTRWVNPRTTCADPYGPYVAKYDFEGNQCWRRHPYYPSTPGRYTWISGLCTDSTGVYLSENVFEDGFVRKYDTDGNEVWHRPVGLVNNSGLNGTCGVSADDTGVYLVCKNDGTPIGQSTHEIFLRKYDADGNPVWTRCLIENAVADDIVAGHLTVTASDGGIYVAGSTCSALSGQTNQGGSDAFVCKYDADGNLLWTRQFGTSADDEATAVSVHGGAVYVGGSTGGTLPGCSSQGGSDAFLLRMPDIDVTARPTSWELQKIPLWNGFLRGIWGSSSSAVFTVGDAGTILHYDGSDWAYVHSGTANGLNGVWGSSPSDVFAVGDSGTVLHYDGAVWRAMASGTAADITGIWGTSWSSVFCVLSTGAVLHYDGLAWTTIYGGPGHALNAVWGSSSSDVFAVGDGGDIVHFDGSSWTHMDSGTGSRLNAVWGAGSSDVYAAGSSGTLLRYDGALWRAVAPPAYAFYWEQRDVNAVWAGSGSVFLGGGMGFWRYDGSAWSQLDESFEIGVRALWGCSDSDVFAVGWGIARYGTAGYEVTSRGLGYSSLVGVWGSSPGDVMAIGAWGAQLRCDGNTWYVMSEGSDDGCVHHFYDIWGNSRSDVYIAGNGGCPESGRLCVWHYGDGQGGGDLGYLDRAFLSAVWGTSPSDVFAVGG